MRHATPTKAELKKISTPSLANSGVNAATAAAMKPRTLNTLQSKRLNMQAIVSPSTKYVSRRQTEIDRNYFEFASLSARVQIFSNTFSRVKILRIR
jgi:hypothetical protein